VNAQVSAPRPDALARLVGMVLVLAVAACTDARTGPPVASELTIGVLRPAAGPLAGVGTEAVRGVELAVEMINKAHPEIALPLAAASGLPGLAGATLAVTAADTGGTPAGAATAAERLAGAGGAAALLVADSADAAAAVGNEGQRSLVPVVDAASTADFLTELGLDWYFRTAPTDRAQADLLFALLRRQLRGSGAGAGTVAILTEQADPSAATAALVRDLAVRAGYTIAVDARIGAGGGSPEETADRLRAGRSDAVLAFADSARAADQAVRAAARVGPAPPVIGLGRGFDGVRPSARTAAAVLRGGTWSAELARRSPVARSVAKLYREMFDADLTAAAANAFTATLVLALAMDASGSGERSGIRAALRRTSVPATQIIMPWTGVRFDDHGQNQLATGVIEGWQGGFRLVYPRELATTPMIWSTSDGAVS
jgi:branched-chain amino acid transport system substrate-binding protein